MTVTVAPEAAAVVIDNLAAGLQGWAESGGNYEWEGSSYWARDGATYNFIFNCPGSGRYEVLEWHSMWSTRSSSVTINVESDDGAGGIAVTETTVNQQQGGQVWNRLGEFNFIGGVQYRVTIIASPGPSSTCADALMFRPVASGNMPPVASNDSANTLTETAVSINVLSNDTDLDGNNTIDETTVEIASVPSHGQANAQTDGAILYTPADGFVGTDTFTYTVKDDQSATSNSATVTITVLPEDVQVIIDNLVAGTQGWAESGGSYEWENSSYWARDGATYNFVFDCPVSGRYEVLEWHSMWSTRSSSVSLNIQSDDGAGGIAVTETTVNQQQGGQVWNPIGDFEFTGGQQYTVTIIASPGPSSTCADALTFRRMSAVVAPSITTHPVSQTVTEGDPASFSVAATAPA